ncbi:MAG TPA: HNH endonuclease [Tepidisphaeraceae bacterium]|nr:HNH endonuclease [Tepidisphaeraceae bacterium]
MPRQHGGGDEVANLALACSHCNLHKGPNWAGIDPGAGALISLFHPRRQQWSEHFHLPGIWINGSTDVGRATVRVLEMNESSRLELRENLRARGVLD